MTALPRPHREVDVLMMTDCRFPGGSSSSLVEEIVAQARAGYRTGVLHVPSSALGRVRAFNPKLRRLIDSGMVEQIVGARSIDARLVIVRHPSVFTSMPVGQPEIRADEVVFAANQVPEDDRSLRRYYDVDRVAANLDRCFARMVPWSPIGPEVRRVLEGRVPLTEHDWENVIDVEAWRIQRTGLIGERPVIGRHSRGHWTKWPDDPAEILRAYPDDPRYPVRVLGGVSAPVRLLGRRPANWVSFEFDEIDPVAFLAGIDVFVYFHHPGLVEAFGRVVLEAMAAGAVCIVPPYLQALFGDACLYGSPGEVVPWVDRFADDVDAFLEQSERGVALALERFSHSTHVGRVRTLIGDPSCAARPAVVRLAASGGGEAGAPDPGSVPADLPSSVQRSLRSTTIVVDPGVAGSGLHPVVRSALVNGTAGRVVVIRPAVSDASVAATPVEPDVVGPDGALVETIPAAAERLAFLDRVGYLERRVSEAVSSFGARRMVVVGEGVLGRELARRTRSLVVHSWIAVPGRARARTTAVPLPGPDSVDPPFTPPTGWVLDVVGNADEAAGPVHPPIGLARWRAGLLPHVERVKPAVAPVTRRVRRRQTQFREVRRRLRGLDESGTSSAQQRWDIRGHATHPEPAALPVVLAVVVDEAPGPLLLQQLVEREQMMSGFRSVALVPLGLESVAVSLGLTAETYVPARCWCPWGHGSWSEYLERRVRTTRAEFGATSVVLLGDGGLDGQVDTTAMLLRLASATE